MFVFFKKKFVTSKTQRLLYNRSTELRVATFPRCGARFFSRWPLPALLTGKEWETAFPKIPTPCPIRTRLTNGLPPTCPWDVSMASVTPQVMFMRNYYIISNKNKDARPPPRQAPELFFGPRCVILFFFQTAAPWSAGVIFARRQAIALLVASFS